MNIVRVDSTAEPILVKATAPLPKPGPGEVLVRVCAAGVTTTELLWYPTTHDKSGAARRGAVPGHEFSGVIEAVGPKVGSLEIGQEVFGMNDWFEDGAMAEYCVAGERAIVRKPPRLSHAEAASVPIGALTAWQGLFDRANLQRGERVLVHGGAGAVGIFAIQLAHQHGAHVIATASAANLELVAVLGAGQVVDYQTARFEEEVAPVDVVFDTVGGETRERSWTLLKPGGRMVTIAADAESMHDPRTKAAFFIVEPNQRQLSQIADLLERQMLLPMVDTVVPLSMAPEAFAGRIQRNGRGKVVVAVGQAA